MNENRGVEVSVINKTIFKSDMKDHQLKFEMKELWKSTFHDSDEYVDLVFDNYYNPDFVEYEERDGKLVSALLGVPYEIKGGEEKINVLYLCGLMTEPQYRRNGIMNQLLGQISIKAKDRGFAACFLIPANDGLVRYYKDRGYSNAIFRVENRYTNIHDFKKEYIGMLDGKKQSGISVESDVFKDYKFKIFANDNNHEIIEDDIVDFIMECENDSAFPIVAHSKNDIENIINENAISGGGIGIVNDEDNKLIGVAFFDYNEEGEICVKHIFSKNEKVEYFMLFSIKNEYKKCSMLVYRYPENDLRKALWTPVYGASDPEAPSVGVIGEAERVYDEAAHSSLYAMLRICDVEKILQFYASQHKDISEDILLKEAGGDSRWYCINKGRCMMANPSDIRVNGNIEIKEEQDRLELSLQQLQEILFRRHDSDHFVGEAFGLPGFSLNGCLFLD